MFRTAPLVARWSTFVASFVGASVVGACSSVTDPARMGSVPALSASEAAIIANGFLTQARSAPAHSSVAATVNPDGSWTFATPCALGGTIAGAAAFTSTSPDISGAWTLTATFTTAPQGCVVQTGARQIAITGDPSLTVATVELGVAPAGAPTIGTIVSTSTHVTGSFTWDGGRCVMDYTVHVGSGTAPTTTVAGTVCGQRVTETAATP